MTQSLSNLINSPLAIVGLLLWVLLLFLAIRQCHRWAKASHKEKIIYQNHPAIPVKEYKLSEFAGHTGLKVKEESPNHKPIKNFKQPKPSPGKQVEHLPSFPNAWDV